MGRKYTKCAALANAREGNPPTQGGFVCAEDFEGEVHERLS